MSESRLSTARDGWVQQIASVGAVVAVVASGTWVIATAVNAGTAASLAAISAQAAVVAKEAAAFDHRVTVVEQQEAALAHSADGLANEVKQLEGIENNLAIAVQRLNDNVAQRRR